MTALVVAYRDTFGLEPICRVLQVSPSAVRSRLARPVSADEICDESLKAKMLGLFNDNHRVYGRPKIKVVLRREHGLIVGKARVARLMGASRAACAISCRPF